MRKVKCLISLMFHRVVTEGKIYDVIWGDSNLIKIINDLGEEDTYLIVSQQGKVLFKDVTIDYRNDLIDDILK